MQQETITIRIEVIKRGNAIEDIRILLPRDINGFELSGILSHINQSFYEKHVKEHEENRKALPMIEVQRARLISDLDLSLRLYNILRSCDIKTVGDLDDFLSDKSFHSEISRIRGLGKASLEELSMLIDKLGIKILL